MSKFSYSILLVILLTTFQTAFGTWSKQRSETLAWLRDAHFFSEMHGLVVGGNGTMLETKDGGATWKKRVKPTEDNILQIGFADAFKGWMLCERDVFNRGSLALSYMMRTVDGGETWERVELNSGRTRVTRLVISANGSGFAIGESGSVFVLRDGVWARQENALRYLLLGGAFAGSSNGAIVGAGGSIYFTEDGGVSWTPANVFGDKQSKLNSVYFADNRNGWAVGASGKVFQTFSGGKTWREQNSGVQADLFDVFFKNSAEGWAVGDQGVILHTTTAGNVWRAEQAPVKHKLHKIVFAGNRGFAVGFGGTILSTAKSDAPRNPQKTPVLNRRNGP
jgi:photosystem II stability/assembly factor-like uncharacterized protein